MWINIFLILLLTICVFTDLKERKIYNKIIYPSIIIAFVAHFIMNGWSGLGSSLLGFTVGLALLLIPYLLGGIGAGDVKLLACIGAIKGSSFVFDTAIYMAVLGAIIALAIILFQRGIFTGVKSLFYVLFGLRHGVRVPLGFSKNSLSLTYPYGVAIAGGAICTLFFKGWGVI